VNTHAELGKNVFIEQIVDRRFGGEDDAVSGMPSLVGRAIGHRDQPPDAADHSTFGHRRVDETAQLLERFPTVLHPEQSGGLINRRVNDVRDPYLPRKLLTVFHGSHG
jgi:hypothetical protein